MAVSKKMVIAAIASGWMLAGAALTLLTGCDRPPPPPTTANMQRVKALAVNPSDAAEAAAAADLLAARAGYDHALKVLHAYYVKTGAYDKQRWAERELKNLTQARPWAFEGLAPPAAPAPQAVEGVSEASLVERVLAERRRWQQSLQALADHYGKNGLNFKQAMVRNVQQRFDPIRTYSYFLHAEVPPATLRPTDRVPAADELFAQALKLHRQGKPLPGVTDYHKQRRALMMFLELIDKHPSSTQIALAAYYIGDIYKEYFNENIRAVNWYQRAWEWDGEIMKPARFQAAVVYDLRLAHYGKAVQLYQEVIKHEQFNRSNVDFAANRIEELTGAK